MFISKLNLLALDLNLFFYVNYFFVDGSNHCLNVFNLFLYFTPNKRLFETVVSVIKTV